MPKVKLLGLGPDQDPTTPGVLTNCASVVPSVRGFKGAPSALSANFATLAAAARGAASLRKMDDTTRLFAGTADAIYEGGSGAWADVTRASGGAYTVGTGLRWRFAQYGNVSLAVQKGDVLQYSNGTGAFANLTAPKASIVETVGEFVFLADTNEGTYGDQTDRWWCSAKGDYTSWTPSVATECATGRLIGSSGPIRAMRRFGDQIVAYKGRSMHMGTYQSAPDIWRFDEIPGGVGAVSQEAVVNAGTEQDPRHLFMGADDFYSFDGSRPVPIGVGWIKEQVFAEVSQSYSYGAQAVHDRKNSRVYFFYPTGGSATCDKCVVYNYRTKQWGRDDRRIEATFEYSNPGITYTGLGSVYTTYADLPSVPYDSALASAGAMSPAIFDTAHKLYTLTGPAGNTSITTGDFGDDTQVWLLSKLVPLFFTTPDTATMTNFYRANLGDDLTMDSLATFSDGRFNKLRSARWHRFRLDFSGDWEMAHINVYAGVEGEA